VRAGFLRLHLGQLDNGLWVGGESAAMNSEIVSLSSPSSTLMVCRTFDC